MLYSSIYDHWMNFTANKIGKYYEDSYFIKYDYKCKYIVSRCSEKKYTTNIGFSNYEKALNNIIEKNWSYLINRFWVATTAVFKIIFFLIALITIYGYICIFRYHLKK